MGRLIVLDAGPVWLAIKPPGHPEGERCRAWLSRLAWGGDRVVIPTIADYECRRELMRRDATASIRRLDRLRTGAESAGLSEAVMRTAARLWSDARRGGQPTAPPEALDADCVLAAVALTLARPDEPTVVATTNVGHLARFPGLDARTWHMIETTGRE
jgi:predicted nucleic acid-binding protein